MEAPQLSSKSRTIKNEPGGEFFLDADLTVPLPSSFMQQGTPPLEKRKNRKGNQK